MTRHKEPSTRRPRKENRIGAGVERLEPRCLLAFAPPSLLNLRPWESAIELTNFNGTLFFAGDDDLIGHELWKSDGTVDGTVVVKDILQGSHGSLPGSFTPMNGLLYFVARNSMGRGQLWKTDGTSSGTVLIKEINARSRDDTEIRYLLNVNGTLFFSADDGVTGRELWKSDGTEAGTMLVKDIQPGSPSTGSGPTHLTDFNGTLFFSANDVGTGNNGRKLWKTDGTDAGTVVVKNLNPHELTVVGETLFFEANDGLTGSGLWKTDGTEEGTVLVKDTRPGIQSGYLSALTNVQNTLYFAAYDGTNGIELWKSDGTEAGTVLVKDINPGGGHSSPRNFTDIEGTIFFSAKSVNWHDLWKTDGTEAGTVVVKDTWPGSSGGMCGSDIRPVNFEGTLIFCGWDGIQGSELWASDGTEAGTRRLAILYPNVEDEENPYLFTQPQDFTIVGDKLFLSAENGLWVLWWADGDFNRDLCVCGGDIDLLFDAIAAGTHDPHFDLTNDALVNQDDVAHLVTSVLGTNFGDANLDGSVDRADFARLARSFGRRDGPSWIDGNFNGDATVGLRDLAILQSNFAPAAAPSVAPSAAGVLARGGRADVRAGIDQLRAQSDRRVRPRPVELQPAEHSATPFRVMTASRSRRDVRHSDLLPRICR